MNIDELKDRIIRDSLKVHNILGYGFPGEIYKKAFILEMEENGIKPQVEKPYQIKYKDRVVGEFTPHLMIDDRVIIQIYTSLQIEPNMELQIKNFLRASGINLGIILNFGSTFEFKHFFLK